MVPLQKTYYAVVCGTLRWCNHCAGAQVSYQIERVFMMEMIRETFIG